MPARARGSAATGAECEAESGRPVRIGQKGTDCPMHGPLGSEPVTACVSIVTSNLRAVPASI
jgi:hypothetical protein